MRLKSVLLGIAVAVVTSWNAEAALYNFALDSANYDVTGQITTTGNLITSIVGNVTGLLNAPIGGIDGQFNVYFTSDNTISFGAAPYVTGSGVLFDAGGYFFNVYSVANGQSYDYYLATNQFGADYFNSPLFNPGSLILSGSISAVPEPSTWIMMIVGFLGICGAGSKVRSGLPLFRRAKMTA